MKLKAGLGIFILLLLSTMAFAQEGNPGNPCFGQDIEDTCPLDTWVTILVIAAAIFAAFHLYRRKQKTFSSQNF